MKRLIMLAFALVLMIGTASAQQNGQRGEGRQGQRGPSPEYLAMIDSLQLDEDQAAQFQMMDEMFKKKRRATMQEARDSGKDRQAMRGEMTKMQNEQSAVLKNLFTEKQYAIYSEFLAKQDAARAARRGGGSGGS
jgi:hypothetical protein